MKKSLLGSLFTAAVLCTSGLSHATLDGFDDYELGGTTASWDIFYGPSYQTTFNFTTGSAGNPLDSEYDENFTLTASKTGGVATGPSGTSMGEPPPGNRDMFYTLFATNVTFTIWGMVGEGETLNNFVLQISQIPGAPAGLQNVKFNGLSTVNFGANVNGVNYWGWSGLGLQAGQSFKISFDLPDNHNNIDAVQIQMDAQSIPEPSTWMLIGLGSAFALWSTRRRAGMTVA